MSSFSGTVRLTSIAWKRWSEYFSGRKKKNLYEQTFDGEAKLVRCC